MTDPIEAHYDAFPYPRIQRIIAGASPAHTAGVLGYLLRRREADGFGVRPRVWVAGCGTQQGSTWGLAFPEGEVLATDVSTETLRRASALAKDLGVRTRFERHALDADPAPGAFDLVVCTGVVHHLASPLEGLRGVRAALAPNGAASILVYSRAHRAPLDPLRRATLELLREPPSPALPPLGGERVAADPYAVACAVLEAARKSGGAVAPQLVETLYALRDRDPSFVADVLLNPREASYDVEEFITLLAEAGLRFVAFLYPATWRLSLYTDDARLLDRAAALGPVGEAALVQRIAGLAGPLLEVLVERDDAPVRAPYTRDERLAMRMMRSPGGREIDLSAWTKGAVVSPAKEISPFTVDASQISGTTRAAAPPGRPWSVGVEALPVLEAFDGTATVTEVHARFAHLVDEETLLTLVETLGPPDVGLLAPVFE